MAYNCKDTLCWTCEWAAGKDGKCSWAKNLTPVEGWEATQTKLLMYKNYATSYIVHNCPLYELMGELKRRKVENAGRVRPPRNTTDYNKMLRRKYRQNGKEKTNEHKQSAGD